MIRRRDHRNRGAAQIAPRLEPERDEVMARARGACSLIGHDGALVTADSSSAPSGGDAPIAAHVAETSTEITSPTKPRWVPGVAVAIAASAVALIAWPGRMSADTLAQ